VRCKPFLKRDPTFTLYAAQDFGGDGVAVFEWRSG
jgi:hypothetical protein